MIKQAFIFSHTKRALRARRVKQTVRWTVCSQSGEQFIIATRGFKPGTQSQMSRRLFCFFFLRLTKEDSKTIPQLPCCASSLCSRAPLNSVYLSKHKVHFPICRAGACSRHRSFRTVGDACPYSGENERLSTPLTQKALRGLGHSRKCPGAFLLLFQHLKK